MLKLTGTNGFILGHSLNRHTCTMLQRVCTPRLAQELFHFGDECKYVYFVVNGVALCVPLERQLLVVAPDGSVQHARGAGTQSDGTATCLARYSSLRALKRDLVAGPWERRSHFLGRRALVMWTRAQIRS